jgi:hypothetical protein
MRALLSPRIEYPTPHSQHKPQTVTHPMPSVTLNRHSPPPAMLTSQGCQAPPPPLAAQAIILAYQLSMYLYFFPTRGSGGALDFNPAAIHRRESAGSITSSTPKCDALLIAFPR